MKKLIIEIDDEVYKTVQDGTYCGSLYEELKAARPYNPQLGKLQIGRMVNGVVIPIQRTTGEWARHDEWVGGEYVGGFYHVNCPCEDGYYSKWRTNFCPNCGQPMMKEEAGGKKNDT